MSVWDMNFFVILNGLKSSFILRMQRPQRGRDPIADIHAINRELERYNTRLSQRPQVIAANKIDAISGSDSEIIAAIRAEFEPGEYRYFPSLPSVVRD